MSGHLARSESFPPRPVYPRRFGSYVLLSEMGHGGMGQVFLAKKSQMLGIDRYCVLKTLRAEHSDKSEYLGRFLDEARVAVHLNHRNICAVTDVGMHGDTLFMAMDLVVGQDLYTVHDALAAKHRRLPDGIALYLIHEMLDALDYAHRLRNPVTDEPLVIVHRDVSPANIMLSFEGEVKLIDFGLANSKLKTEHTRGDYVMGKLAYLSPEQATNQELDARSDMFSASIVAYELLTGERFYEGLIPQAIWKRAGTGDHEPRRMKELDPELAGLLRRALHAHPDARYASCADFRKAIDEYRLRKGIVARGQDAREFMESLFPDGLKRHRERLAKFADIELPPAEPSLTTLKKPISMEGDPVDESFDLDTVGGAARESSGARSTSGPQLVAVQGGADASSSGVSGGASSSGLAGAPKKTLMVGLVGGAALFTLVGVVAVLLVQSGGEASSSPPPATSPVVGTAPAVTATPSGVPTAATPPEPASTTPAKPPEASAAAAPAATPPRKDRPEKGPRAKKRDDARKGGSKPASEAEPDRVAHVATREAPAEEASDDGRRGAERSAKDPGRARRPAPTTTGGKQKLLQSCSEPCAKKVLDMADRLQSLDLKDMRRYPQLLDQCVERCR